MKIFLSLFIFVLLGFLAKSIVNAQGGGLMISEFAAVTDGTSTNPDWVEIYNESDIKITLENFVIKDSTDTNKIVLGDCISSKSYRKFDFSNRLNNSGDSIRLFSDTNTLLDELNYFSDIVPIHPKGSSSEKNIQSGIWTINTTPNPTNSSCDQTVSAVSSANITFSLSEIYPAPEKGGKEWVELKNTSNKNGDLEGWSLVDDAEHEKSLSGTATKGSYIVFYFPSGWLNNGGDSVSILNPAGKLIEKYEFSKITSLESFAKNEKGVWNRTSILTPKRANKFSVVTNESTADNASKDKEINPLEATGLSNSTQFLTDTFNPSLQNDLNKKSGKVAGAHDQKNDSKLSIILFAAGTAFLAVSVAWPFLEKYKII